MLYPVITTEQNTHSLLKMEGAEPVSAGFFHINDMGFVTVDMTQGSESLGLMPEPDDIRLLTALLCNATASCYLDFD